jgi:hypothetical protein
MQRTNECTRFPTARNVQADGTRRDSRGGATAARDGTMPEGTVR